MQWQRLLRSAAAVVGAAAVGCESAPLVQAANPGGPPTALVQPAGDPAGVRPQKGEGEVKPVSPTGFRTAPDPLPGAHVVASVRATVNGVPILDQEVNDAAGVQIQALHSGPGDVSVGEVKKIKAAVLEQLIERELLVQDAKTKLDKSGRRNVLKEVEQEADEQVTLRMKKFRDKYKSDEEFDAFLRANGTSMEEQKRIQRRILIAQQYLHSNVMRSVESRIGHQEIYEYYKTHPEEFQRSDSVQWQDIFIDASKYADRQAAYRTAEQLAAQARTGSGDDFVKLCEKYDNGLARTKKGAGIGTRREDITPPEAAGPLLQMRDGDVGPIVSVPAGFHVIRLAKRTFAGPASFDETVQKAIKDKLKNEAFALESKRFLDELKKSAHVERVPF